MKVIVAGKGDVCRELLLYLRGNGVHVPVVFTSKEEREIPHFAEWLGIKEVITEDINLCVDYIKELAPDYILSFQYHKILKPEVVKIPPKGCINLHFGLLPNYRGMAPIAHAMINGEEEICATLHYMDEGIDTGGIIAFCPYSPRSIDTAADVYRAVCKMAVDMFKALWPRIRENKLVAKAQDKGEARYYTKDDLDFSKNEFKFEDFVDDKGAADWLRAMIFPKFQTPYILLDGVRFHITEIKEDV
jgi:methionyl-tRNA formyltransferase